MYSLGVIPFVKLNQHEQASCGKTCVECGLTRFELSKEALQPSMANSMANNATHMVGVSLVATKSRRVRFSGSSCFVM